LEWLDGAAGRCRPLNRSDAPSITVLLVDDDPGVRAGLRLRLALEADLRVVGEAADGLEAVERAGALRPDVVVMDVVMPGTGGIAATSLLRDASPASRVVLLTLHDGPTTRSAGAAAGALALVAKHEGPAALLAAIRAAGSRGPGQGA
jgi:DNA-binding NarL/FixJ family response regulator